MSFDDTAHGGPKLVPLMSQYLHTEIGRAGPLKNFRFVFCCINVDAVIFADDNILVKISVKMLYKSRDYICIQLSPGKLYAGIEYVLDTQVPCPAS